MYQFLDEMDMWSLVEKNPKEAGVLEKHNTFLNWNGEHIASYLIHLNKNKTK
jgi:hypothetical protein